MKLATLILCLSWLSLAAGRVNFEVTPVPPEVTAASADELRQLMHEAHDVLESQNVDANYLRRLTDKFNYSQAVLKARRWYLLKTGDLNAADHAANLVLMYLTSHTIETYTGSALASFAVSSDQPFWAKAMLVATGVTISIPFFDPLCWSCTIAYGKWPTQIDSVIQWPRIGLVKTGHFLGKITGINALLRWAFSRESAAQTLTERLAHEKETFHWTVELQDYVLRTPDGKPVVAIKMVPQKDESLAVSQLEIHTSHLGDIRKQDLRAFVKPFGWNVRNAVEEVTALAKEGHQAKLAERKYIDRIEELEEKVIIYYKVPAVRVGSKLKVNGLDWLSQKCAVVLL